MDKTIVDFNIDDTEQERINKVNNYIDFIGNSINENLSFLNISKYFTCEEYDLSLYFENGEVYFLEKEELDKILNESTKGHIFDLLIDELEILIEDDEIDKNKKQQYIGIIEKIKGLL